MQSLGIGRSLNIASLAALLAAVALSLPVVERIIAAVWQRYKFAGYPDSGHINLSLSTGLLFSCILAATFGFSLCINRLAKRRAATRAATGSLWAMYVVVTVAASYWLLGLSVLNVWRA